MNQEPTDTSVIAQMLDSIEEAIGADISWSSVPPPVIASDHDDDVASSTRATASTVAGTTESNGRAAAAPAAARAKPRRTTHPFEGLSAELRVYPDPPPPLGERMTERRPLAQGTARDVIAKFHWDGDGK